MQQYDLLVSSLETSQALEDAMANDAGEDNDDTLRLKTKRAWTDKRECFSPDDINDDNKLARMRQSTALWDDDFNELSIFTEGKATLNRKATRAHFKLKSGIPRTITHRDSADPTHNDTVDAIHTLLKSAQTRLHLTAKAWNGGKRADNVFWKQHILSDYAWHKEPATRLLMESGEFIQPDIVGIDITRMNRTATNPGIIIEVVHHHWPDESTFAHLMKLSTLNYIVAFYFVRSGHRMSTLASAARQQQSIISLTVGQYIHQGVFFNEGKPPLASTYVATDYHRIKRLAEEKANSAFDTEKGKPPAR